jgi:hypothetical protein
MRTDMRRGMLVTRSTGVNAQLLTNFGTAAGERANSRCCRFLRL